MSNSEAEIAKISRLLTPQHRADLLAWVRLAHFAENSARKSPPPAKGGPIMQSRDCSCENIVQRRKK
jgi:hypothetical protein